MTKNNRLSVSTIRDSTKRLPRVVIVGRPNVGKSTLFNRIIGRRAAVVQEKPGITRDRLYGATQWGGKRFEVVDTGGILFSDDDPLIEQIRIQAQVALQEADVVLFVCDGVDGCTPSDQELADALRSLQVPKIVVVNKADNNERDLLATDFYKLGMDEVYPISALHGRGVAEVLDRIVEIIPESVEAIEQESNLRIAIVGRPNVGKSSLLNALIGEERAIVSDIPGTTRDTFDTEIEFNHEKIVLIDTAGLRRRGKIQGSVEYYMALRAQRAMQRSDLALVVVDGSEGLTDGDKRVAKSAHEAGKACVFVVNKWDLVEPPDGKPNKRSHEKLEFTKTFRNEFPELDYAPICFASAQTKTGLEAILETCLEAMQAYHFRVPTATLNKVIREAVYERPYSTKGKSLKVYYATQVSVAPPKFSVFCNDPSRVHFSYERYLMNKIRANFPLEGTPIRLEFRSSRESKKG